MNWKIQNLHRKQNVLKILSNHDENGKTNLIEWFLKENNYTPKGSNHEFKKYNFIDNRFKEFENFINKK